MNIIFVKILIKYNDFNAKKQTKCASNSFCLSGIMALLVLCLHFNTYAHKFEHPATWGDPAIVQMLKTAKIINIKPMRQALKEQGKKAEFEGEGEVFLVDLENGTKAVFKSPFINYQADSVAEIAAYKASLYLGFPRVPPVVLREIGGMKGSIHLFVNTPIDLLKPGEYKKALQKMSQEDVDNLKIFYFIFGQWDTGPANLLAYTDGSKLYPIAIDNAKISDLQYVRYGELPFICELYNSKVNPKDWDTAFPFENAQIMKEPTAEKLRQLFGDKLPKYFYDNVKFYGAWRLKYIFYKNIIWRQYRAFDQDFVKSYVADCRYLKNDAIKNLDLNKLKEIFADAKGADFLTDGYLEQILERRDQVLQHLKSKCHH